MRRDGRGEAEANCRSSQLLCERAQLWELRLKVKCRPCCSYNSPKDSTRSLKFSPLSKEDCTTPYVKLSQFCHKQLSASGEIVVCLFDTLREVSLSATSFRDMRNFRRNP